MNCAPAACRPRPVPNNAQLTRDGDTLRFSGVIDRAAVIALWPTARRGLAQIRQLDLHAVQGVDSAGLALLAELAGQLRPAAGERLCGTPPGLAELCAAYRLSPTLDFNAPAAAS
ncbi:STAS domain-containing protein [Stenotrophomonas sp. YIM B06876]|uniref:STAS domain-containing protein n=1 Tax=Stenotrophomonas sp. YIM B06876 TaxID=3060211 RepID=UPI002738C111|nr:STAS domain-containing protein [Stenotrophomonas sp. YIM B06876]